MLLACSDSDRHGTDCSACAGRACRALWTLRPLPASPTASRSCCCCGRCSAPPSSAPPRQLAKPCKPQPLLTTEHQVHAGTVPSVRHPLYADAAWMERGKVSYGQHIIDTGMRLPCLERTPDVVHSREARIASSPTLLPGHMLRLGCIVAGCRTMNWLPGQQDRRTRAGTWSMSGVPHLPAT